MLVHWLHWKPHCCLFDGFPEWSRVNFVKCERLKNSLKPSVRSFILVTSCALCELLHCMCMSSELSTTDCYEHPQCSYKFHRDMLRTSPTQNVLGVKHNGHASVWHTHTALTPHTGSISAGFFCFKSECHFLLGGVGSSGSGSTLCSWLTIPMRHHSNTLMAVCQVINPSVALGRATVMSKSQQERQRCYMLYLNRALTFRKHEMQPLHSCCCQCHMDEG